MTVLPYKDQTVSKKEQVAKMFDDISGKYDFLNHTLSMGIDRLWRKKAINLLKEDNPKLILDIATGTGDFAIAALRLNPDKVIGVDISRGMLEVGKEKIKKLNLESKIELSLGDSEGLEFEENKFDAVIVAFGVRNFEHLEEGLQDMYRVMKDAGKVVILEFSRPRLFPFKQLYNFYFRWILPKIGRLISKDQAAYTYLPESVKAFPDGQDFLDVLNKTGFKNTACKSLTFGISSIYTGIK
ncbi:MAG: bifunctional demethylmenaquinone methyltransferase/2-methoxy-6-polyprenyl-1,4-benzoquinol methylase UbiE [Cytophagales bacterium]|nr:bifunctional demethylmenaquinone methyltransferase/2-methoxy-6-polyprenyl-1,4-benzoquinol methylase UbiE [Cytophagales bacterium]